VQRQGGERERLIEAVEMEGAVLVMVMVVYAQVTAQG
jgi:hypothetical protein